MKTSKEMQLKIIDKMRENIESGMHHYFGIETEFGGEWRDMENDEAFDFLDFGYRIKGCFITINGVEIPKPLRDSEILEDVAYYHVDNSEFLYNVRDGEFIHAHGIRFVYSTAEEAIEASKLLFGIK